MREKINIPEDIWSKARIEYCTSELSIRGMCKKYGVPYSQALKRCKDEGWEGKKLDFVKKSLDKSVDLLADHVASEARRAFGVASKALTKLDEAIDDIDPHAEGSISCIKEATYVLKNLKEIGLFKSALDEEEQVARIKKLQMDAIEEDKETTVTVKFEGDVNEYCD